eukprot:53355-Eustigmatos_ZCMA.PRE.1
MGKFEQFFATELMAAVHRASNDRSYYDVQAKLLASTEFDEKFGASDAQVCTRRWVKSPGAPSPKKWWDLAMSSNGNTLIGVPQSERLVISKDGADTWTSVDTAGNWGHVA